METTETTKQKRRRQFQLDTKADVQRCMAQEIRKLRRLEIVDKDLDPIRVNKTKVLVQAYRTLSQLMDEVGLGLVSDEALRAEIHRRLGLARGASGPGLPVEQATAGTH